MHPAQTIQSILHIADGVKLFSSEARGWASMNQQRSSLTLDHAIHSLGAGIFESSLAPSSEIIDLILFQVLSRLSILPSTIKQNFLHECLSLKLDQSYAVRQQFGTLTFPLHMKSFHKARGFNDGCKKSSCSAQLWNIHLSHNCMKHCPRSRFHMSA